jgi:hypothetical protein
MLSVCTLASVVEGAITLMEHMSIHSIFVHCVLFAAPGPNEIEMNNEVLPNCVFVQPDAQSKQLKGQPVQRIVRQ